MGSDASIAAVAVQNASSSELKASEPPGSIGTGCASTGTPSGTHSQCARNPDRFLILRRRNRSSLTQFSGHSPSSSVCVFFSLYHIIISLSLRFVQIIAQWSSQSFPINGSHATWRCRKDRLPTSASCVSSWDARNTHSAM